MFPPCWFTLKPNTLSLRGPYHYTAPARLSATKKVRTRPLSLLLSDRFALSLSRLLVPGAVVFPSVFPMQFPAILT